MRTRTAFADLKNACRRHGITQDRIAAEAGVTRPLIVNVFAGRNASRNVVDTARRLVAAAEKRLARARARKRATRLLGMVLFGLMLSGCALLTPSRPSAAVLARDFTALGTWPYRIGPLTVLIGTPEFVRTACTSAHRAIRGQEPPGPPVGCYIKQDGKDYIITVAEWDVLLHEIKHFFEGPMWPGHP